MESAYTSAGSRTKRAVSRIRPANSKWDCIELQCFEDCKLVLSNQVTLSDRIPFL